MKKLIYFLIPLFLFVPKVKADLVSWSFAGFQSTDDHIKSTYYDPNETQDYGPNYFVFDTKGEFFVKVTTCSTGDFTINSISNINGVTFYNGRYQGSKCNVQGYEGYIQEYYFTAKQTYDAGSGNRGVIFNVSVKSVPYYSLTDFLGVYVADTIPQQITLPNYSADFGEVNYRIGEVETSQQEILERQEEIINEQHNTTNAVNKVDDTLKDDNIDNDNVSSTFEGFNSFLDDNSTITQLITLPITLYTSILNNVGASCQPFSLGSMYGEELVLPCVNIGDYLGSTVWGMIDLIISGFAIYAISKKLIKVFNTFSSMKEGDVIDD